MPTPSAQTQPARFDDRLHPTPPIYSRLPFITTGKVHGSLARAGKVRSQTPKVAPQEKKKKALYNRRFVNVTLAPGGKRRMNPNPEGKSGST
ncbi:BQ2448_2143 [Microbotryum intermedium]|uniref:BQ2448_2143 protein n=1 Tax=Microbotryum intermedium TaxID=269621 RepID=A0A238FAT3_9BASI|nr:BQ2448_2143 [Microbotryum intermedium]